MSFNRIIVATDLSDVAGAAARWAVSLSEITKVPVVVCYVVEVSVRNWLSGASEVIENAELRAEVKASVGEWFTNATGGRVADDVWLDVGSPLQRLSAIAETHEPALLVASATGAGRMSKFLLGSTVQSLVMNPPCPVVVVEPEHAYVEPGMAVLVGTDFSANADCAVELAIGLVADLDGDLEIVHSNAPPPIAAWDTGLSLMVSRPEDEVLQWSEEQMLELVGRHPALENVKHHEAVLLVEPAHALIQWVQSRDIHLTVLGHSGEEPVVQTVLGSTALRFLNELPSTLVIVPGK